MAARDCKQFRVVTTAKWIAIHGPHGKHRTQPAEHQPPAGSYRINLLICPCGAKHVIVERSNENSYS